MPWEAGIPTPGKLARGVIQVAPCPHCPATAPHRSVSSGSVVVLIGLYCPLLPPGSPLQPAPALCMCCLAGTLLTSRTFFRHKVDWLVIEELDSVSDCQIPPSLSQSQHHPPQPNTPLPTPRELIPSATMSLNIPNAPNAGLFKGGYNKSVPPLSPPPPTASPAPEAKLPPALPPDMAAATMPKMAPSSATSTPAGRSPRPSRPPSAPTDATRSSSTTSRR
jgi:hypothetical protein